MNGGWNSSYLLDLEAREYQYEERKKQLRDLREDREKKAIKQILDVKANVFYIAAFTTLAAIVGVYASAAATSIGLGTVSESVVVGAAHGMTVASLEEGAAQIAQTGEINSTSQIMTAGGKGGLYGALMGLGFGLLGKFLGRGSGAGGTGSGGFGSVSNENPVWGLPRIGGGVKGEGSGGKVDFVKPTYDARGNIVQEFTRKPRAHGFPDIVDNFASDAVRFELSTTKVLYQLEGSQHGVLGRYEWIVDREMGGVTHRMFVSGGKINGIPIKP